MTDGVPASTPGQPWDEHLAPLLRAAPSATAVAILAIRGAEQVLLCRGHERREGAPTTPDTRFELGSVTKTFTALLLADMVAAGEVGYDDPIGKYLPAGVAQTGGEPAPITLLHLATHTSGLPRLPPGLLRRSLPRWFSNPYATFTEAHLHQAVARSRVRRRHTGRVRYSNLGVGLLGHLLGNAAGTNYPSLLAARILGPLSLEHTTGDPEQPQATGYFHGRPRPPWHIPGLPAAGALRSTAHDLQRYLQAHLTPDATTLPDALRAVQRPRATKPGGRDQLGLVWNLRSFDTYELLFHSGATRGFTTFIGFSPQAGMALAALANTTPTLRSRFIQDAYTALKAMIKGSAPVCHRPRCPEE